MRASAPKTPSERLYIFAVLLFLWILIICFRLVRLQVVKYGDFMLRAERQQNRTIPVEPRRGNIYDRNGYALAMSIDVDSVFAVPSEIHDPGNRRRHCWAKFWTWIRRTSSRGCRATRNFVYLKRKIDADTAQSRQAN